MEKVPIRNDRPTPRLADGNAAVLRCRVLEVLIAKFIQDLTGLERHGLCLQFAGFGVEQIPLGLNLLDQLPGESRDNRWHTSGSEAESDAR